jgi:hypothetical protein
LPQGTRSGFDIHGITVPQKPLEETFETVAKPDEIVESVVETV